MTEEINLHVLNEKQRKDASDLLKHYNFVYICNKCGHIYGSDKKEFKKICPICDSNITKRTKVDRE